mgnify:CR=1 FL=1
MGLGLGLNNYIPFGIYLFSICLIFLILFKDRKIGILYFLPLLPLTIIFIKMQRYPLGKDLIDIILIIIIIAWFLQNKKFIKTKINLSIYFFIIYTFFELLNGYLYLGNDINIMDVRMEMWKNYMIMPAIFFIVLNNIQSLDEIKQMVFNLSVIYLVIAVKFAKGFTDPGYFDWSLKKDPGVTAYLGANFMSSFMVMYLVIFLCLFYYFKEDRKFQIYYLVIVVFGAYNILFLFSRGGYIAFVVVMLILGVLRDRKILAGLVILIMFWNYILPTSVFQRINMTLNAQDELGGESTGRNVMWQHAYENFQVNPLFGTGYQTFKYTLSEDMLKEFEENIGRKITNAHGIFFEVLAEMGIVGLILLLLLFFLAARSGWKLFRSAGDGFLKGLGLGFFLSVISSVITNLFGDNWSLYQIQGYYWIFWALTERGLILTREQNNPNIIQERIPI